MQLLLIFDWLSVPGVCFCRVTENAGTGIPEMPGREFQEFRAVIPKNQNMPVQESKKQGEDFRECQNSGTGDPNPQKELVSSRVLLPGAVLAVRRKLSGAFRFGLHCRHAVLLSEWNVRRAFQLGR